jgi:hypothetical protein
MRLASSALSLATLVLGAVLAGPAVAPRRRRSRAITSSRRCRR